MEETNLNEEDSQGKAKQWIQDNLRIIISVIIVVLIAGGIYSYSNRTQAPTDEIMAEEDSENQITAENAEGIDLSSPEVIKTEDAQKTSETPVVASQETESSFIETAVAGNGATHLARRALANYLEKNPDSALTAEHKIYIEDYLRKNVSPGTRVTTGTTMEFSKDLIQDAITKSKTLTDKQLNNLKKYSVRVPSLS
ncbi:MAG: hypothetical protein COU40_00755 [Candidatus Moranbacteria bacterium CG10_big_fil_rev_8_21_14_0_10_35_21]|nr:MAG: hypothetical protein COU40_00755 [Candidatus Moranbacteria bacterium CG10_big_fil_rev_8_21_14_0_10_35_21]PJA88951.1 MAG: hypothetical protein CO139_00350 [Candidatus Moranbacteria bacterium CG_4_9_14_3_um_filter_36_9]